MTHSDDEDVSWVRLSFGLMLVSILGMAAAGMSAMARGQVVPKITAGLFFFGLAAAVFPVFAYARVPEDIAGVVDRLLVGMTFAAGATAFMMSGMIPGVALRGAVLVAVVMVTYVGSRPTRTVRR